MLILLLLLLLLLLIEITPDIKDKLPPTDTRFRPDQRLYEDVI